MHDKSRKETNGSDKFSVHEFDVNGPSKDIRTIKCLASRTGIHLNTKLPSKNLDFHPVCLTPNCKNRIDAPGLRAVVPAPELDDKICTVRA
ncbi:hypothetical protein TNCV_1021631 [Trichonephila clavipes]|uniref:Uncharacterized protein n=1 Tax=Trichonephila clavipes TaxID=2585209 RepID=A0A8X6SMX7_TRICX|nr:hypothetical protein TNCV_1021631 [Trichonephila clavipes]